MDTGQEGVFMSVGSHCLLVRYHMQKLTEPGCLAPLHTERPASTADMHGYKPVQVGCGIQAHLFITRGVHTVHLLLAAY